MAYPPSPPLSASMSRSRTSIDNTQSLAEAILRSGLPCNPFSTSSTATTLHPYPDTPDSHTKERSTSRTSEQLRLEVEELRLAVEKERTINERLKREGGASELSADEAQHRILQLKREISAAGAELPQRSTAGLFKAVCSTDLLFLIDTTGSMLGHINAAKEQVRSIVNDIGVAFLNEAEVRMAVVGYKDHIDNPNIQFLDFTPSADQVRSFLNGLSATGGFDTPEDVL